MMSYHHLGEGAEPDEYQVTLEALQARARRLGYPTVTDALDQLDIEADGFKTVIPKL